MTYEAPDFFSTQKASEAQAAATSGADAADQLRELAKQGRVVPTPVNSDQRAFMAPLHPNGKFLAKAGTVNYAPYQTAVLGMKPAIDRTGDVWVQFTSGICSTNDPIIIAWCEAHAGDPEKHREYHERCQENPRTCGAPIGLCREKGPHVDDWYKMKLAQVPLKNRERGLDPEIDVDGYILGAVARESHDKPASKTISQE